jgi:hypothetical protein
VLLNRQSMLTRAAAATEVLMPVGDRVDAA